MSERMKEIQRAIQDIERNLLLMSADASAELTLMIERAEKGIRDYNEGHIENIKKVSRNQ